MDLVKRIFRWFKSIRFGKHKTKIKPTRIVPIGERGKKEVIEKVKALSEAQEQAKKKQMIYQTLDELLNPARNPNESYQDYRARRKFMQSKTRLYLKGRKAS